MSAPQRVQLRRTKGWRMPANTVSVARPGKFGNPYRVEHDPLWYGGRIGFDGKPIVMNGPWMCVMPSSRHYSASSAGFWFQAKSEAKAKAIELFRFRAEHLITGQALRADLIDLRGKNLACWCPLHSPCHADVLLDLANRDERAA